MANIAHAHVIRHIVWAWSVKWALPRTREENMLVQIPSTTDAIDDRGRIYKVICSVRTCTVAMHVMCCVRAILALASSTQLQNGRFFSPSRVLTYLHTCCMWPRSRGTICIQCIYWWYIRPLVVHYTVRGIYMYMYLGNSIDYHCVSECAQ